MSKDYWIKDHIKSETSKEVISKRNKEIKQKAAAIRRHKAMSEIEDLLIERELGIL